MINRPSVYIVLWLVSVVGLSIGSVFYPWMYYYPYGETVTLKPLFKNDSDAKVTITKCKWISPDRIIFDPDAPTYETNKHYVDKAKCELTIFNIQKDTDGIYHCIVNDKFISKALLNVHGAPKQSTLEEYTPNLIAGFSTAGGIIAFFAFTCAVYRFRYQSPVKMEKTGNLFLYMFPISSLKLEKNILFRSIIITIIFLKIIFKNSKIRNF